MTWIDVFVLGAFIISVLRILVIVNSRDSEERNTAPWHWLLGIILFCVSWSIIRIIFPTIKIPMKIGGEQVKERTYQNSQSQDSIYINIRPKKRK